MSEHTPWKVDPETICWIRDCRDKYVAYGGYGPDEPKTCDITAFIVKAVNCHAALVEALKGAIPYLEENYRWHREMQSRASLASCAHAAVEKARAALALAGEAP